ncbi:MAG: hypothetical protein ACREMA_11445 [Longimicrobiales bacterium]
MPATRLDASVRWDNGKFSAGTDYRHALRQDDVAQNETVADAYDVPRSILNDRPNAAMAVAGRSAGYARAGDACRDSST